MMNAYVKLAKKAGTAVALNATVNTTKKIVKTTKKIMKAMTRSKIDKCTRCLCQTCTAKESIICGCDLCIRSKTVPPVVKCPFCKEKEEK